MEIPELNPNMGYLSAEEIIQNLQIDPKNLAGKDVLDMGAGTREIATYCHKSIIGCTVVSFDYDIKALTHHPLEKSERNLTVCGLLNTEAYLPFEDESFDLVLNHSGPVFGYANMEANLYFLAEALRILRPGGKILILEPFFNSLIPIFTYRFFKNQGEEFDKDSSDLSKKEVRRYFYERYQAQFDYEAKQKINQILLEQTLVYLKCLDGFGSAKISDGAQNNDNPDIYQPILEVTRSNQYQLHLS